MSSKPRRMKGLRVVTRTGVNRDVRRAALRFAAWLRMKYEFPTRLTVYLFAEDHVISSVGEHRVSLFFEPKKKTGAPIIHVATGDYGVLRKQRGNRDDALCAIVCEVAEHFINYENWWFAHGWSKTTIGRRRDAVMRQYATDVEFII